MYVSHSLFYVANLTRSAQSRLFRVHRFLKRVLCDFAYVMCETWPLALKEEHRLGVFENRVL
jgi:hypothetical protein